MASSPTLRVLFTCRPAFGHYPPLVPLARALTRVEHEVHFATGSPQDEVIRRDGFEVHTAGLSVMQVGELRRRDPRFAAMHANPRLMRPINWSLSFAGFEVPPRAADLLEIVKRIRPDFIIYETSEFAGPLVAAIAGVPSANHSFGPLVEPDVMASASASAAEHWLAYGLVAPDRAGMYGGIYLDITPSSIQFKAIGTLPRVQPMRPEPFRALDSEPVSWLSELGDRPVVAVTLGTVFSDRIEVYRTVIDALVTEDVEVVVATGDRSVSNDLRRSLPSNAQVHDWVPWGDLVKRASVVVTHGGAGSTLAALSIGVPLVMIPLGADHFRNADMLASSGAAVVLETDELTRDNARAAVVTSMTDSARSAVGRIADEISMMPTPEDVVPVLASLAVDYDRSRRSSGD